jgi:hypothetical protein
MPRTTEVPRDGWKRALDEERLGVARARADALLERVANIRPIP